MVDKITNNNFGYVANLGKLQKEVDKYKKLFNEESQLVEQLQQDKDQMDLLLMQAEDLFKETTEDVWLLYFKNYKGKILRLIKKARSKV
jgi:glutaredoxin 2